jgi:hypothetical protein
MQASRVWVAASCLAMLGIAACGGDGGGGGGEDGSTAPASLEIVAGNGQTAEVGRDLPGALVVRVMDAAGRAVIGANVVWSVTSGGGAVAPASAITDAEGMARTQWTLGAIPGSNTATATVVGLPAATFSATAVRSDVAASVTVTSPTLAPYEGDTLQLLAIARDSSGNVLPDKLVTWSSSNPAIAPVSQSGSLQTWGTGEVTVSATVDGVVGTARLSLTPILVTVTVGAKEVVFDWTTDRCEDYDVPDGPARFVRAGDGSLVLFSGNAPRYFVSRGSGFNAMQRDCAAPVLISALRDTPESYENVEWVWSVYREASSWHALLHNEYHDAAALTCQPGNPWPGNPCWYNSISYAVSTDEARSFSKPAAPAHTVAPAPNAWVPPEPGVLPEGNGFAEGYFEPSNIVRGEDGYYYAFLKAIPTKNWTAAQGLCVFRSNSPGDPSTWRAWDGKGFNLRMTSPYATASAAPVCAFLDTVLVAGHIVYDAYLERYILVSAAQGPTEIDGRSVCGILYSLSADLIHWSQRRLLAAASLPWCPVDPVEPTALEPVSVLYPSLVDHADATVNFERAGRTPHLYYTRFNDGGLDRDLVRVPLTLTRTN